MDMKHVKYLALVLCIGNLSPVMAQTASKSLTVDNLVAWQRISGKVGGMQDGTLGRRCCGEFV